MSEVLDHPIPVANNDCIPKVDRPFFVEVELIETGRLNSLTSEIFFNVEVPHAGNVLGLNHPVEHLRKNVSMDIFDFLVELTHPMRTIITIADVEVDSSLDGVGREVGEDVDHLGRVVPIWLAVPN